MGGFGMVFLWKWGGGGEKIIKGRRKEEMDD